MTKLVLIDGNAIMHRAYHALPKTLTNKKGELTNAVYGFTSMLLKIIEDLSPTHLAVCFDRKEPTFRKKLDKNYQAHRPETDKDLASQFAKVRKLVDAMNIPIYDKAGFEADDLIGTLAKQATESRRVKELKSISKKKSPALQLSSSPALIDEVVIVTGDRDILQLVNEKVKVYLPIKGLSNAKLMSSKDVYSKLGVEPAQVIDLKALTGDPSDNYKGVPGIGPVTAQKLITKHKTYKNIYKNIDKIDSSIAEKLKEGKESGDTSYELAKIVTNVDFDFDINETSKWDLGRAEVNKVFDEIGFKTLKNRVQKKIFGDINKAPTQSDLKKVVKKLANLLRGKQYAIRGTMSLVLQGFDMGVGDVDVLADKKTALSCNRLLKTYLIEKVEYKETDQYKSFIGKFVIDRVLVEVYAEWQIKGKKGWSEIYNASGKEISTIKVDKFEVNVTKPDLESSVFVLEGRWNAYHKLKKQIEEKNQMQLL